MFRPFATSFASPPSSTTTTVGPSSTFPSVTGSSIFGGTSSPPVPAFSHPHTPYSSTKDIDNGAPILIHAISAMPNYANESFEEIRVKDYAFGRKGRTSSGLFSTAGTTLSAPSTTTSSSGGLFGQPSTFGAHPSSTTGSSMFGTTSTTQPSTSIFGSTTAPTFGTSTFGGPSPSPFGTSGISGPTAAGTSAFGATAPSSGPTFGSSLFGATSAPSSTFGASPFGTSSTLGPSAPTSFGTTTQPSTSGTGSMFGAPQPMGTTSMFGQPSTSTTGVSPFGGQSIFSGGAPSATSSTAPSFSGFGQPASSAPTTSLFGTTAPTTSASSAFGPASTSFGFPTSTAAKPMFGAGPTTTTAPSTSLFGPSAFGGAPSTTFGTTTSSFPSGASGTGQFGSSLFGTQQAPSTATTTSLAPQTSTFTFPSAAPTAPSEMKPFSFGAGQQPSAGFGQAAQQPSTSSMFSGFGAPKDTSMGAPSSTFSFGAQPSVPTGGLFGAAPSFNFGQQPPSTLGTTNLFKPPTAPTAMPTSTTGGLVMPLISPPAELMSMAPPVPPSLKTTYVPPSRPTIEERKKVDVTIKAPVAQLLVPKISGALQPKSTSSKSDIKRLVITVSLEDRDENKPQQVGKEEVPKRLGDFYMHPTEQHLNKLSLSQLKAVKDLVIGQKGVGEIKFLEPVDLSDINLNDLFTKIVRFEPKQVAVYPEEYFPDGGGGEGPKKPPPGQGLNHPAIVTLERCWPTARGTRIPITDPDSDRMKQHIERLKSVPDTTFISFDVPTGTWKFKVEHFSKYGLSNDNEEDDHEAIINKVNDKNNSNGPIYHHHHHLHNRHRHHYHSTEMAESLQARQIIKEYLKIKVKAPTKPIAFLGNDYILTTTSESTTELLLIPLPTIGSTTNNNNNAVDFQQPIRLLQALADDNIDLFQEWLCSQLSSNQRRRRSSGSSNIVLMNVLAGRFPEAIRLCTSSDPQLAAVIASFNCLWEQALFDFGPIRRQLVQYKCNVTSMSMHNIPVWEAMAGNEDNFAIQSLLELFALRFNILSDPRQGFINRLQFALDSPFFSIDDDDDNRESGEFWVLAIRYKIFGIVDLTALLAKLPNPQLRLAVAEQFFPNQISTQLKQFLERQIQPIQIRPLKYPALPRMSDLNPSDRLRQLQLQYAL